MRLATFAVFAAGCTFALIAAILPWLRTRALAGVNQRSSHTVPTPQGAGLAVVVVTASTWLALLVSGDLRFAAGSASFVAAVLGAVWLALVGFLDDTRGLPVGVRLASQAAAVLALVAFLPADLRVIPYPPVPVVVERAVLVLAGIWFINVFNFMDGIDWITFVETAAIAGGIAGLWILGTIAGAVGQPALLLVGSITGFAFWNRPRARVFLGDAGSLPVGLLLVWLMIEAAAQGAWAAVLLFSLYYWGDATLTLLLRLRRGERVWQAHREHFYQQATRPGRLGVPAALGWIAGANAVLMVLGFAAELLGTTTGRLAALAGGLVVVLGLLRLFADR